MSKQKKEEKPKITDVFPDSVLRSLDWKAIDAQWQEWNRRQRELIGETPTERWCRRYRAIVKASRERRRR